MEESRSRIRPIMIAIGLFLAFGLILAFTWRVFTFYRQIQAGTLDTTSLKFAATTVSSTRLAGIAKGAPGSGVLATLDDPYLGEADAPITIVEFADFGCPHSAETSFVVRAIAKQFPKAVKIIYRDFPIVELHPGADLAAVGGECAQEQGKFWEYHDAVYEHSGEFTEDSLVSYAEDAGLNVSRFETCLASDDFTEEVVNDLADGVNAGVRGTPTFFVNGVKVEGSVPFSVFTELIHAFLNT
jgi:protein-disulfide isomerase